MSSSDQFSDALSSVASSIGRHFSHVADAIDKNVDFVADQLRDQLQRAEWLPAALRPLVGHAPMPPPPPTAPTYERVCSWVLRHRTLTGVLVLAATTAAYRTYKKSLRKRRRARRDPKTGARLEVVVLVGNVGQPLTREIALDLEAKGFIVFIQASNAEEEATVQTLSGSRPDIRALSIDMRDPSSSARSVERFSAYLQQQHSPGPRVRGSKLTLAGLVLIPSLDYTTAPIATIAPSSFEDIFETHLLQPIRAIQAFLPLLTASPQKPTTTTLAVRGSAKPQNAYNPPKVLVLTPGIISSINPPWHVSEATVCAALAAFSDVLAGELRPLGNQVTQIRLGSFYDFARSKPGILNGRPAAMRSSSISSGSGGQPTPLEWPEPARHVYGRNFVSSQDAGAPGRVLTTLSRGWSTSPRQLYAAVFDVLDGSNTNSTVYVGLGAGTYGFVGRFVPRSLVGWMMGIRSVGIEERSGTASPHYYSPASGRQSNEPVNAKAMAAMEGNGKGPHESFVAVDPHHVWNDA